MYLRWIGSTSEERTYRDGGRVVGQQVGEERGGVALLLRGRPAPQQLGGGEHEQVVVGDAHEDDGVGQQLAHRGGALLGDHLRLGAVEVAHLRRQRDALALVLRCCMHMCVYYPRHHTYTIYTYTIDRTTVLRLSRGRQRLRKRS
jgi:hypothetical protein